MRLLACLAATVSLTGCFAVGPDYKTPDIQLAAFHNVATVKAEQAGAKPAPLDKWWTGFRDPLLVRIVERTLDQNLNLAASQARVEQARAAARGADAKLFPTVDATGQDLRQKESLNSPLGLIASNFPGYSRYQSLYDVGISSSWEIDVFGGLRRGAEAAQDTAEAAEAEHLGTRITVVAEAADAYLQVRGNQQRLQAARGQIAADIRLLEVVRDSATRGASTDREVAQTEAVLAQARTIIPPLQTALEAQLNRLDVLMGAQPGTFAKELKKTADIPPIPKIPAGITPADLLRRRPDVIAAERQLAASSANIGAAIAGYYPKISLSGLLGFESITTNKLLTPASFQPQVVGGLRWRLFDFGKVDAEVAQAKGANAAALAQYRQSILQAASDVENAFMSLVQLQIQTRYLVDEVDALTRARDASQRAFEAGANPLTDVLDAQRQLLIAQDNLARSRADSARAAVTCFRALGGGW